MVRFSNSLQRLSAKHYKSTILFIISLVLHIGITFAFAELIGIWSCIIGTAVGNIFLGVSFVFYNKKYLQLRQNLYLKNLFILSVCSVISVGLTFLFSLAIKSNSVDISNVYLMLIEGFTSVFLFSLLIIVTYRKKVKDLFLVFFNDAYSISHHGKISYLHLLRNKLSPFKNKINMLFPFILILYFIFNFASYYLGGLNFISVLVSSSAFAYLSKIISYLILIFYGIIFALCNRCKIRLKEVVVFISIFAVSLLSSAIVPKTISFITVNEYRWTVLTTFNLGVKDLVIGNINWLIDLLIMFFYLYIFRQATTRKNLIAFMRFIVAFTLVECIYSFVFQYRDYLYFFSKASGDTSFNGYATNLSGTFASKNGFGFLLFQSIIASFYLTLYDTKLKPKLYWVSFVIFNIVNVFSLCKTSALASIVFDMFIFASWLNKERKKNFKVFVVAIAVILTAGGLVGLCFTPLARKISFIDSVIKKVDEIFLTSGGATIKSRILLWEYSLKLVKGPYLVFGYGKTASSYFLNISSNFITHTFHNGVLDILCSFGIFGVALYFYGIRHSYKESTLNTKSGIHKTLIIAIIVTTLLYGLMENVYLLMSSSSTMFVSNIVLAVSDENGIRKRKPEVYAYVETNI